MRSASFATSCHGVHLVVSTSHIRTLGSRWSTSASGLSQRGFSLLKQYFLSLNGWGRHEDSDDGGRPDSSSGMDWHEGTKDDCWPASEPSCWHEDTEDDCWQESDPSCWHEDTDDDCWLESDPGCWYEDTDADCMLESDPSCWHEVIEDDSWFCIHCRSVDPPAMLFGVCSDPGTRAKVPREPGAERGT